MWIHSSATLKEKRNAKDRTRVVLSFSEQFIMYLSATLKDERTAKDRTLMVVSCGGQFISENVSKDYSTQVTYETLLSVSQFG